MFINRARPIFTISTQTLCFCVHLLYKTGAVYTGKVSIAYKSPKWFFRCCWIPMIVVFRPREYWDYEAHVVEWGNQVTWYIIIQKVNNILYAGIADLHITFKYGSWSYFISDLKLKNFKNLWAYYLFGVLATGSVTGSGYGNLCILNTVKCEQYALRTQIILKVDKNEKLSFLV